MPAATRSPPAVLRMAAAATSMTPLSRVMCTPGRMPRTARRQTEAGDCSVCLDPEWKKRSVKLDCGHKIHLTCAISWLESRNTSSNQTCPLCRTRVKIIQDMFGYTITVPFPYGAVGLTISEMKKYAQPQTLNMLQGQTMSRLEGAEREKRRATAAAAAGAPFIDEYVEDIDMDIDELKKRSEKIREMLDDFNRGNWTVHATSSIDYDGMYERILELQRRMALLNREGRASYAGARSSAQRSTPAMRRETSSVRPLQQVQQVQQVAAAPAPAPRMTRSMAPVMQVQQRAPLQRGYLAPTQLSAERERQAKAARERREAAAAAADAARRVRENAAREARVAAERRALYDRP